MEEITSNFNVNINRDSSDSHESFYVKFGTGIEINNLELIPTSDQRNSVPEDVPRKEKVKYPEYVHFANYQYFHKTRY